jgi:hypothetical protein
MVFRFGETITDPLCRAPPFNFTAWSFISDLAGGLVPLSVEKPTRGEKRPACAQDGRGQESPLTPELEGFIKRTIVPLLVARYIQKLNHRAQETTGEEK